MAPYAFTRLTPDDLPLVRAWLGRPHVAAWWPEGEQQVRRIAEAIGSADRTPYLVSMAGQPFAYLQCERHAPALCGVDQLIGEADLIGRGHGSSFVRQFCDQLFAGGEVTAVTTGPDQANARAIRAYEKAGFLPVERQVTPWGNVLLMRREYSHEQ
jgi:aminoglycoside 6'-N-acetyltransferase